MKTSNTILAILLISLITSFQAGAQTVDTRAGLGISLGKEILISDYLSITMLDNPSFYVPIIVGGKFRIEPEFSFMSYSGSNEEYEIESKYKTLILGLGLFPQTRVGNVDIYYGIRLGIMNIDYHSKYQDWDYVWDPVYQDYREVYYTETEDESKMDFFIGPAVGGEYFFSEHFSLGGEIQGNFVFLGQYDDDSETKESMFKMKPLVFVRWYF